MRWYFRLHILAQSSIWSGKLIANAKNWMLTDASMEKKIKREKETRISIDREQLCRANTRKSQFVPLNAATFILFGWNRPVTGGSKTLNLYPAMALHVPAYFHTIMQRGRAANSTNFPSQHWLYLIYTDWIIVHVYLAVDKTSSQRGWTARILVQKRGDEYQFTIVIQKITSFIYTHYSTSSSPKSRCLVMYF